MAIFEKSLERQPGTVKEFGPDFFREGGEPMVLRYLQEIISRAGKFWWSEGDLGERGKWLDQKRGIDGFLELRSKLGKRLLMGTQITCANLQNPEVRERLLRELESWARHPTYKIDGEAEVLGCREGEEVPVVFFHIKAADVSSAWEASAQGIDWHTPEGRKAAEEAASRLPHEPKYVGPVLSSITHSLDKIEELDPGAAEIVRPYQELFAEEQERLAESTVA